MKPHHPVPPPESVRRWVKRYPQPTDRLLVCVSGGADSVCLLHCLVQCWPTTQLRVFHFDHASRPHSATDAQWVRDLAAEWGLPSVTHRATTSPTRNREASWRTARHAAAQATAQAHDCQHVLTAHHATDLVETVYFRLTKGTGLSGLSPFHRPSKPLYHTTRAQIESHCHTHQLPFLHDPSNDSLQFQRNLLRHQVIPHLRTITPNLETIALRLADHSHNVCDFLAQHTPTGLTLPLTDFQALHPIIQTRWLRQCAAPNTPSQSESADTIRWLTDQPQGNSHKPFGGGQLQLSRGLIHYQDIGDKANKSTNI